MKIFNLIILLLFIVITKNTKSNTINIGINSQYKKISTALLNAISGDTLIVNGGFYKEGNIVIDKSIVMIGKNNPILDGDRKFEVMSIKANYVSISGFRIQHSSYATLDDPGGIKVYNSNHVNITDNFLVDNFFGIYLQYCQNCTIKNNKLIAFGKEEQQIGNGIHCWKSDSLIIVGNNIKGHRDGIYFEFVTHSVIWRNISMNNIRYGLHFMFSNNDSYFSNLFKNNGAGVAVMFTKKVTMMDNTFEDNWGDSSYGVLLKEISDSYLSGNKFLYNTTGIFMDGTNRIVVEKNEFIGNGWGMKIQANCMDNLIIKNNFFKNTFDISTNGTLVLNTFNSNFWDKYEGFDLNKDLIGDIPYHPLSLFSVIVENNPPSMLLYRSFIISLLDKSEKVFPSLTPENFIDKNPLMKSLKL
ncbi:MAG: nitrous oxide reductase family maturation protein NosD [Chlorobiota bacterium]|nr:nitrous oxide reductase family maturation protein NosD [Chlorobiota bacterium]QQS67595.1 MAG: nitrous oxide reductase family maturation protein NosD [Chlorobiota bacterium]